MVVTLVPFTSNICILKRRRITYLSSILSLPLLYMIYTTKWPESITLNDPECTFTNNQKEMDSSRRLKIKELFYFWQATDRKNLTEPMQKCQIVVIRIVKMLWKHVCYWFMMMNGFFALEITVSGKRRNMNLPFFICYFFPFSCVATYRTPSNTTWKIHCLNLSKVMNVSKNSENNRFWF